jgi:hypothetical protein
MSATVCVKQEVGSQPCKAATRIVLTQEAAAPTAFTILVKRRPKARDKTAPQGIFRV